MKSGQTDDNDRLLFGRRRSANNNRALKPSNPYWICTTSTYQSFFNYIVVVYLTIFFFGKSMESAYFMNDQVPFVTNSHFWLHNFYYTKDFEVVIVFW